MNISTERLRELREDQAIVAANARKYDMPPAQRRADELVAIIDLVLAQREQKAVAWEWKPFGNYGWLPCTKRDFEEGRNRRFFERDDFRELFAAPPTSQLRDKCAELVKRWKNRARRATEGLVINECASELAAALELP